ncbi:Exodeoxyribonuclease VII large subunit [hydrothermal vent metagenome]|uniref:Exodeoxyribonuclease VII large subunit n=1 Tax=hydrothermal vent metagenome TaxID=652676 RepID=A0A3B1E686_9ZZZZ
MNTTITVSALNEQIKASIETIFSYIFVEGEISNLIYHNSGHIYFSLKDKNSVVSCVMFRGNAKNIKFRLEVGQKIVISGSLTVYVPRGNYQLLCSKIEPSGVGALSLAYEQLKTKLQIKGYFDISIKKQLPTYPRIIYIITSNTGAVIEDMKKILEQRYTLCKVILLRTLVQGDGAKENIVKNIKIADTLALKDGSNGNSFIVIGRGGGSAEDLWAFNEECVADAIYESATPIISAVGHESDFVISDFVADVRASTPSNAIEISTPHINELRQYCDTISDEYIHKFKTILFNKEQNLKYLFSSFYQQSFHKQFMIIRSNILHLKQQFEDISMHILKIKSNDIKLIKENFIFNQPSKKDKKGFVQLTKDNKMINLEDIKQKDIIVLQNTNTTKSCEVL